MKKKNKTQKPKSRQATKKSTALVPHAPERRIVRHSRAKELTTDDRTSVVDALNANSGMRGVENQAKEFVAQAFARAAYVLAPHFAVSAPFLSRGVPAQIENTEILTEVLCSAGAWLAHARGVPASELREKFGEWMSEQGYK